MRERIAQLMQRLASALETPPCRDFDELVARALPAIRESRDIAVLDVEAQHQPPRILLATSTGWRLVIDLEGIRAWKQDLLSMGVAEDGVGQAAIQRRFARPADGDPTDQRSAS
ncbi:MAG: hypothetical protein LW860_19120 [Xanthomonadaceae bacterium]|jgi:hypothetical protein|nr:hypothetical protein [Xanthomonadaceae bacterium]